MKIRNLFRGKNKKQEQKELSVEKNIDNIISETRTSIKIIETEIESMKKDAIDIIRKIFTVPSRFWYEELTAYEQIKEFSENANIGTELLSKTDKVMFSYRKQLALRHAKIDFYVHLIDKYMEARDQAYNQTQLEVKNKKEQIYLKELQLHEKKLENMEIDSQQFNKQAESVSDFEQISEDIKSKEQEIKINKEIFKEINQLTEKYNLSEVEELGVYQAQIEILIEALNKR